MLPLFGRSPAEAEPSRQDLEVHNGVVVRVLVDASNQQARSEFPAASAPERARVCAGVQAWPAVAGAATTNIGKAAAHPEIQVDTLRRFVACENRCVQVLL